MLRERGTTLRGPQRFSRTSLPLVGNVASEAPLGLLSPPGTGQAPALGRLGAGHNVSIRTTPLTDKKLSPKGLAGHEGDESPDGAFKATFPKGWGYMGGLVPP